MDRMWSKGEYLEDLLEENGKDGGKEARKYEKGIYVDLCAARKVQ